jgi:hypothetical protein
VGSGRQPDGVLGVVRADAVPDVGEVMAVLIPFVLWL